MATVTAILDSETNEDEVIKRLDQLADQLGADVLDWRVMRPEEDTERILPAMRLGGDTSSAGVSGAGTGVPLRMDLPEDLALEDRGVPDKEADFYAGSHADGATVLVVKVPSDYVDDVHHALRQGGATRITDE